MDPTIDKREKRKITRPRESVPRSCFVSLGYTLLRYGKSVSIKSVSPFWDIPLQSTTLLTHLLFWRDSYEDWLYSS